MKIIGLLYYTSCIQQFWATTKANTFNGERQLQALVDKKRVIITELSIRSDLHLADVGGIDCLPTATIFEELARMGRKQRKETEVPQDETHHDDSVPIPSNDPLLNGLQRLRKVGESSRVESSKDKESLDDLHDDEVIIDILVGEKQEKSTKIDEREVSTGVEDSATPTIPVTTADEGVTAAKIDEITPTSPLTTVIDELNLAQTLIEIKAAKPKAITTTATTTTTRPRARGVVVQEPKEDTMARKKEEEANIALIESWENTQAMMEADRLLAERLRTRKQEELTDEEKAKLFMEFIERRIKHFAALRAQEKRNRPPTKAQKRNQMSVYLKHMGDYKHNQLKGRSYDEIQKFSAKRAGDKLESDESKKQKTYENKEVEEDNEVELKMHMVIVKYDDIAVDAIPLATKPPVIVEYKIIKEEIIGHY
ncbi:hypothetical protein Tco_0545213 [Tanacetum coccineum]